MALLGEMRERTQNLLDPKPQMDSIRGSGQGTPSPGGQGKERCWVHLPHEHCPVGSTKVGWSHDSCPRSGQCCAQSPQLCCISLGWHQGLCYMPHLFYSWPALSLWTLPPP